MSTRTEDIGRIIANDPRVQSGQLSEERARLRYRLAQWRSQNPARPEKEEGAPGVIARIAGEFARGVQEELTLGHGSNVPIVGGLFMDPEELRDQSLDLRPGGFDVTDLAAGAGRIVGALPVALATGGLANLGARFAARRLATAAAKSAGAKAAAYQTAARAFQYVSSYAPDDAARWAKLLQRGSRNVYEGLAYSAVASPIRRIDEGTSRARVIAEEVGIGAAADFLLGVVLPTGASPRNLVARLRKSDIDIDRNLADAIDAELSRLDETPLTIEGEVMPALAEQIQPPPGPRPAALPGGRPLLAPPEPRPESRFIAGPEGVRENVPPERRLVARTEQSPIITPPPEGSVLDPNRVDRIGPDPVPQRILPFRAEARMAEAAPIEAEARILASMEGAAPRGPEAPPPAPEERIAVPEAPPAQPEAPRFRGREAQAIADELVRAQTMGDIAAAAANIRLVPNAREREALLGLVDEALQRVQRTSLRAGGEVPPRPTEPPAETPGERSRLARRIRRVREQRDRARRAAETDPLTGAGNRAALDRALPTAEADPNTAVVVFDANNFGQVNKQIGQEAGDAMIREIHGALVRAAEEVGVPGRIFRRGGDEFVILAPKDKAEAVRTRAEEIFGSRQAGDVEVSLSGTVGDTFREADATLQARKAERKARAPAREGASPDAGPAPRQPPGERAGFEREADLAERTRLREEALSHGTDAERQAARAEAERTVQSARAREDFEYGAGLARMGRELPEDPSNAARLGYEWQRAQQPAGPAPAGDDGLDALANHELGALARRHGVNPALKRSDIIDQLRARGVRAADEPAPARAEAVAGAEAEADLERKAAAARARRQEEIAAGERIPGAEGRETTVKPGDEGEPLRARYRVVESDALQPSHNPETFQPNPRYPEGVQERPYHTDRAAQEFTVERARELDADILLDPTVSSASGPPVVTPEGIVLGGNNRTMMIQLAMRQYPERFRAYREALEARAAEFGLDPEQVRGMQAPVLVREVEPGDRSRDALRALGERLNTDPQKAKDTLAEATTRAARLMRGTRALQHLERTLDGDETVRDYLSTANGRKFLEELVEDGVFTRQEISRYRDPRTGVPTEEGKRLVENMLRVAAIGDPDVVARARGVLRKLDHAVPAIVKAKSIEGFNIDVALREALDLLAEARANDMTLEALVDQLGLFGARDDNPFAVTLARFLDSKSQREVSRAFREFAQSAREAAEGVGENLFGEKATFRDTFRRIFGGEGVGARPDADDAALDDAARRVTDSFLRGDQPGRVLVPGPRELRIAAQEVAALADRVRETLFMGGRDARAISERWFRRGTNWIESLGEHGRELAAGIRAIDQRGSKRSKNNALDTAEELKGLTRAGRETVMKIVNGRIKPEDAPAEYVRRADRVRAILDRDMEEARRLGFQRLVGGQFRELRGSGKAFPQVPNEKGRAMLEEAKREGLASPRVRAIAEMMVRNGQAVDIEDALDRILRYRDDMIRGVNRYFERTRFELPEEYVEWDPHRVLPALFEKNAMTIEAVREWGLNLERAATLIGRIEAAGDVGTGRVIKDFISWHTGVGGLVTGADRRFFGMISNYETLARMGYSLLSVLRNMGSRVTNTAEFPLSVQLRALRDYPPLVNRWIKAARELGEQVERTGAIRNRTALGEFETRVPGQGITRAALKPFTESETGNQITAALVAKYGLERDIQKLASMPEAGERVKDLLTRLNKFSLDPAAARLRRVKRLGMSDEAIVEAIQSGGRLTPEQIETAMHRLVSDTQFPLTFATERIWWSTHPLMRLMAKFKPFAVEQTALIYERIVKEAVLGNPVPLAKFVAWTVLMGELYNIARDLLTGSEESLTVGLARRPDERTPEGVALRVLKDMADGGGVGILADLLWGIEGWVLGPVGSTLSNAKRALLHTAHRPSQAPQALWDFVTREVSVSRQIGPLRRRLMGEERFFQHRKWRNRAFEWREEKEADTPGKKAARVVGDILGGRTQTFETTERTLSYSYAARAITAGDVDRAAEYLARVLEDAKNGRERAEIVRGIRQSMASQSPLGPVAERDLGRFLSQFPPEDRAEARRLQREWVRDYERAIRKAIRMSRR